MYVIRPQFFIPMITLLRNAAMGSLRYKQELAEYKQQNIDVTNFEAKMCIRDSDELEQDRKMRQDKKTQGDASKKQDKRRRGLFGGLFG